jgi:hypothetical protein
MYVYVISNEAFDGWLKVGKTKDIKNRMYSMQTGAPTEYVVELLVELEDDVLVHWKLDEWGVERKLEWFKCDRATARKAVLEVKRDVEDHRDMVAANRLKAANDGWLAPRGRLAPADSGAGD